MTYRASAAINGGAGVSSAQITVPGGTQIGDIITVLVVATTTGHTDGFSLDNGNGGSWTKIGPASGARLQIGGAAVAAVYRRVAVSGDAGTNLVVTSVSGSTSHFAVAVHVEYDVDPSAVPVVAAASQSGTSTDYPGWAAAPNASSPGGTALYAVAGAGGSFNTFTAAGGTTLRTQASTTAGGTKAYVAFTDATYPDDSEVAQITCATGDVGTANRAVFVILYDTFGVELPIADAGSNQTVAAGAQDIQLNGTASGGGGAPFTHSWRIISDTTGGASLSATDVEDPTLDVGLTGGQVILGYTCTDAEAVESLEDTVTVTVLGAALTAVPIGDWTASGWTVQPGTTTVASAIGDGSDATWIAYADPDGNVVAEGPITDLVDPEGGTVTVWWKPSIFSGTSGSGTLILKEGESTVIASWNDAWDVNEAVQYFAHTLNDTQKGSVSDWTNLRLRFEGTVS